MDERLYYLGFSVFPGIGPMRFEKLLKRFGSARSAWKSSLNDLKIELGEKTAEKFEDFRKNFSIEGYVKVLSIKGVSFLTIDNKEYPQLLKQIENPPFVLYVKGQFNSIDYRTSFAIVGTRKITQYGREATELITSELVQNGFTVVSGLALGVDAVAHKKTLELGGKTIAVLGCGVDCCTPAENSGLYEQIIKSGGIIVSEFPIGHPPTVGSFPSRNRIIAGLSMGVLVTEGAEDSGALITANYAFKNNRKVFAVPGPITSSLSKGPYKLLTRGAKLVTNANDIIQELNIQPSRIKNYELGIKKGETKEEQKILDLLENEGLQFDEIVRRTKIDSSKIGSLLSLMEIKGVIKSSSSGIFSIVQ